MDGSARAVGAGVPVKIGERTYVLSPLRSGDYGLVEQAILAKRKKNFREVRGEVDGLPEALAEKCLFKAMELDAEQKNFASEADYDEFAATWEGRALMLWLMLRREHKDEFPSVEAATVLLDDMTVEELEQLSALGEQASGTDSLGKPTGPTPPAPAPRKEASGSSGKKPKSTGGESAETSQKPTDSPLKT